MEILEENGSPEELDIENSQPRPTRPFHIRHQKTIFSVTCLTVAVVFTVLNILAARERGKMDYELNYEKTHPGSTDEILKSGYWFDKQHHIMDAVFFYLASPVIFALLGIGTIASAANATRGYSFFSSPNQETQTSLPEYNALPSPETNLPTHG